ncbi:MAG: DUF1844 domain-containing protein [Calditrichaeota bacterium]|nr:DUF1844 domain-containing protein [Calditrichota bacterium]MQY64524.1 DUF1844 domain-containing protein [Calditrichota bacterium]
MTESQSGPSNDQLFVTLMTDLITQAWVALGKIKHPATDKIERSIPAARLIIDMLDMLNRKTAGNRSEVEDRLLLDALQQLKLNFVTEADDSEAPGEEVSEEAPAEAPEEEVPEEAPAEAADREETTDSDRKQKKSSAAKSSKSPKPSSRKK